MMRNGKILTVLASAFALMIASHGQAQQLPTAPVPVTVTTLPHPEAAPGPPAAPVLVAPPNGLIWPPPPSPPLAPPPDLISPPPGFFVTFEGQALFPHIKNRLAAPVMVDNLFANVVHLPTADLDDTGSPRIELGYRFPQGFGGVVAAYRNVTTEGFGAIAPFDLVGDGALRSRLNLNTVDLDFASRELSVAPCWNMQWQLGARLASAFFDSRAIGFIVEERTNNNFFGAGPHGAISVWRRLDCTGLSLFGRVDGAVPIGRTKQAYEEIIFFMGNPFAGGATDQRASNAVPVLSVEAGLGWVPPASVPWVRLTGGYHWEKWWGVGDVGTSNADLIMQGLFLRAEISF